MTAIEHLLAKYLAGAKSSGEVGVENGDPILFRHGECGGALDSAGTVDQNVDFTELVNSRITYPLQRSAVANVGGEAKSLAADCFDRCGSFIHLLLASGRGNNIGAGLSESERKRATNAGCSSGDNGDFSFQT